MTTPFSPNQQSFPPSNSSIPPQEDHFLPPISSYFSPTLRSGTNNDVLKQFQFYYCRSQTVSINLQERKCVITKHNVNDIQKPSVMPRSSGPSTPLVIGYTSYKDAKEWSIINDNIVRKSSSSLSSSLSSSTNTSEASRHSTNSGGNTNNITPGDVVYNYLLDFYNKAIGFGNVSFSSPVDTINTTTTITTTTTPTTTTTTSSNNSSDHSASTTSESTPTSPSILLSSIISRVATYPRRSHFIAMLNWSQQTVEKFKYYQLSTSSSGSSSGGGSSSNRI